MIVSKYRRRAEVSEYWDLSKKVRSRSCDPHSMDLIIAMIRARPISPWMDTMMRELRTLNLNHMMDLKCA